MAPDPAVGAAPAASASASDRSLLADRAVYVPLDEWPALGRDERRFVQTIVDLLYQGKGALLHTVHSALARLDPDDRLVPVLERIAEHQSNHLVAVETLRRRLAEFGGDAPPSQGDMTPLTRFLDQFATSASQEEAPAVDGAELGPRAIIFSALATGILGPSGLHLLSEFFGRNDLLDECGDLVDALRRHDERLADEIAEFRDGLQEDRPDLETRITEGVEESVVACIELVRGVRQRFDYLSLGLVPDEFVVHTLDRFFRIGTSPTTGRPSAG